MHFAAKVDLISHLYICLTRVIFRIRSHYETHRICLSNNFILNRSWSNASQKSLKKLYSSWSKQNPQSVDRTSNKSGNSRQISGWNASRVESSFKKNIWRITLSKRHWVKGYCRSDNLVGCSIGVVTSQALLGIGRFRHSSRERILQRLDFRTDEALTKC